MSAAFHKYERIKQRKDFRRVYEQGKKIRSSSFVFYFVQNKQQHYRRLGITARKKLGNAVTRNRCKRLVRELFRRNKELFPPGSDVIVVITQHMLGKQYAELEEEFYSIRHKERIFSLP